VALGRDLPSPNWRAAVKGRLGDRLLVRPACIAPSRWGMPGSRRASASDEGNATKGATGRALLAYECGFVV
jgi:hypothetical protein